MRTISEQELKDVLDKHGKWLRSEEGGERADLSSANLSSANLCYANLRNANLCYANLRNANLSNADLRYADLRNANLSNADLCFANLRYADLRFANLSNADLRYADLSSANLRYADLMVFQFSHHQALFTLDGTLRIGCEVMSIVDWAEIYFDIGIANGYSELEIEAYGGFIKTCLAVFDAKWPNVAGV